MTPSERQALEELADVLDDFVEHPENWARIQNDRGEVEYKYLGPPREFAGNQN